MERVSLVGILAVVAVLGIAAAIHALALPIACGLVVMFFYWWSTTPEDGGSNPPLERDSPSHRMTINVKQSPRE